LLDLNSTLLGIELRTWVTGGAIVPLVAVAHVALRWWTRRRARKQQEKPLAPGESAKARYWVARGLSDAVPPIAFLLWLHGLCFALGSLLGDSTDATWVAHGLSLLGAVRGLGTLLGLAWLLARIARTLESLLQTFASRTEANWDDVLLPFAGKALRLILPLLALILGTPALAGSDGARQMVQNAVSLALIGTIGFILVQFVNAMAQLVLQRYRIDVADNRAARGIYTQVTVLKKMSSACSLLPPCSWCFSRCGSWAPP
jgi:hypothetical protein